MLNNSSSQSNDSLPPTPVTPKTRPYSPTTPKGHRRSISVDLNRKYYSNPKWLGEDRINYDLDVDSIDISPLSLSKHSSLSSMVDSPVSLGKGFEPLKLPIIDLDDITAHSEALKRCHDASAKIGCLGSPVNLHTIDQLDEESDVELNTGDYSMKAVVEQGMVATPRSCLVEQKQFSFPPCNLCMEKPSDCKENHAFDQTYDLKEMLDSISLQSLEEDYFSVNNAPSEPNTPHSSTSSAKTFTKPVEKSVASNEKKSVKFSLNTPSSHIKKKQKRSYTFPRLFRDKGLERFNDE